MAEHPLALVIEGTGVLVLGGESRISMYGEKKRIKAWRQKNMNKLKQMGKEMNGKEKKKKRKGKKRKEKTTT